MKQAFFITGTDTEVGKTYVSCLLLRHFRRIERKVAAWKPIAAGCNQIEDRWCNDDALSLKKAAGDWQTYPQVNPIALRSAIAPHIAAQQEGLQLSVAALLSTYHDWREELQPQQVDIALIEGAGGWMVPLNDRETMADFVREAQLPVVLVVSMKLGCLNHALLSVKAIESAGLRLAGWVANCAEGAMNYFDENLATLKSMVAAPCLGVIAHKPQGYSDDTFPLLELPY